MKLLLLLLFGAFAAGAQNSGWGYSFALSSEKDENGVDKKYLFVSQLIKFQRLHPPAIHNAPGIKFLIAQNKRLSDSLSASFTKLLVAKRENRLSKVDVYTEVGLVPLNTIEPFRNGQIFIDSMSYAKNYSSMTRKQANTRRRNLLRQASNSNYTIIEIK